MGPFFYLKAWQCPTLRNTSMYFALRASAKAHYSQIAPGNLGHMGANVYNTRKYQNVNKKKPISNETGFFIFKAWQCPTLTWGSPTLPSALSIFTSEFGMGSGGTYSLLSPSKLAHVVIVEGLNL